MGPTVDAAGRAATRCARGACAQDADGGRLPPRCFGRITPWGVALPSIWRRPVPVACEGGRAVTYRTRPTAPDYRTHFARRGDRRGPTDDLRSGFIPWWRAPEGLCD